MSFYAIAWAWQQTVVSPAQKLILLSLADSMNEETGLCIPSTRLLSEQCSMSERTVTRHISAMEDEGLISVQERWTSAGRQTSNSFCLIGYSAKYANKTGGTEQPGEGDNLSPSGVSDCHPQNLEEEPRGTSSKYRKAAARPRAASANSRPRDESVPDAQESPAIGGDPHPKTEEAPPRKAAPPRNLGKTPALPDRKDYSQLTAAAEQADTPYRCALRFKELSIRDKKIDPAHLKEFTATLKRWYADGVELEVLREMVDIFAAKPHSYMTGRQDIPWRAFINAREKLYADAAKVAQAKNPTAGFGNAYARAMSR